MAKKENTNMDELTAYYSQIYATLENNTIADPYGSYIFNRVKGGQKTVFSKTQTEIRNFDMSYLDTIESVYPAILKIMRDPKKSIRYDEEVVAVEKAKKVNSQTVRHLSSHTQLIKEITKEGDVIPSKVLTTFAEEEIAIYENRFIKSLVKRIEMFLEHRYEIMKVSLESFETQRFTMKDEFLMSGQMVTCNLDIAIKNDLTVNIETTKEQYNRLLNVREMIQGLKGTEFMRALAKARDVLPPIMKTNIIMHNPDFKLCYGLWLYLDRVDGISNDVDVREKNYKVSKTFEKDMAEVMALALTSFIKNREIEGIYSKKNLPTIKAPKTEQVDDVEMELNLGADNNKTEDYTMNEYLLSQTAKFFEASAEGLLRSGTPVNESIKTVYRQMLDMLDQIYPLAFGVSDEELESKSLYEQIEYARRRIMVLQIVRQQKQMNLARMGKEEKRIEKVITKLENKIKIQEEQERERLERQRAKEEAERQAAIERERKFQERKNRLEQNALQTQKDTERIADEEVRSSTETAEEAQTKQIAKEKSFARREHLRNIKNQEREEERKKQEAIEAKQAAEKAEEQRFSNALNELGLTPEEYEALEKEYGSMLDSGDFDEYIQEEDENPQTDPTPQPEADSLDDDEFDKLVASMPEGKSKEEPEENTPTEDETSNDDDEFDKLVASMPEGKSNGAQGESEPDAENQDTPSDDDDEFAKLVASMPEGKSEDEPDDSQEQPSKDSSEDEDLGMSEDEYKALEAEYGDLLDSGDIEGLPEDTNEVTPQEEEKPAAETKSEEETKQQEEKFNAEDLGMSEEEYNALEAEYGDLLDSLEEEVKENQEKSKKKKKK